MFGRMYELKEYINVSVFIKARKYLAQLEYFIFLYFNFYKNMVKL